MVAEPQIFTKNYVNSSDTFNVDSGSGSILNICDRDNVSQWQSFGANSDLTDVTLTITFYEGTQAISRVIDSILLTNHNIKAFDLYYWDGSAFQLWHAFTALAASYTFYSLSSQTTTQVKLVFHTTQVADEEKKVGELNMMALLLAFTQDFTAYNVQFRQYVKDLPMGDGSLERAVVRWTYSRITKYEATWSLNLATDTLWQQLLNIKALGVPILWYPESISRPSEIWYCHWYDAPQYNYSTFVKSAGNLIQAMFKEV